MKKIYAVLFLLMIVLPNAALGATLLDPYWGPIVSCVGGAPITGSDGKIIPTCTSLCDIFATAQNALRLGITIAIYIMVPAYVMFAAFKVATAGVSGEKISMLRKMFTQIVIGILLIIGSFTIVNTFMNGLAGVLSDKDETSSWLKISCKPQTCSGLVAGYCPMGQTCVGGGTEQNPYRCEATVTP